LDARADILRQKFQGLASDFGEVDVARMAEATSGLTGADLKRLVEDGKLLFAADMARDLPIQPVTEYFLAALETLRANKERYAAAEMRARQLRPDRPPWFDAAEL